MKIEFIGYLAIAAMMSCFCALLLYFGLKDYNDRDPITRGYAKIMLTGGVLGFIIILIALVDAWHS